MKKLFVKIPIEADPWNPDGVWVTIGAYIRSLFFESMDYVKNLGKAIKKALIKIVMEIWGIRSEGETMLSNCEHKPIEETQPVGEKTSEEQQIPVEMLEVIQERANKKIVYDIIIPDGCAVIVDGNRLTVVRP